MPSWTETPLSQGDALRHPYELYYASAPGSQEAGAPDPARYYPQLVTLELTLAAAPVADTHADWQTLVTPAGPNPPFIVTRHDALYAFAALLQSAPSGGAATCELLLFLRGDHIATPIASLLPTSCGETLTLTSATLLRGDPGQTPSTGIPPTVPETADTLAHLEKSLTDGTPLIPQSDTAPPVGVVIDHAIGFANQVFRRATGTRFAHVWAQDDSPGTTSSPGIGHALNAAMINAALSDLNTDPYMTEADLYARLGTGADGPEHHHLKRRASHGTAVAHVAFGTDPDSPEARLDTVDLMAIQLPAASVARTNGFLHDLYVISGLNWLWHHALHEVVAGRPAPAYFVTHAFGTFAGRHDGFDGLSAEFDRRLNAGELRAIAAAAGNSLQSATHAQLSAQDLADPAKSSIGLAIQPDDRTASFVQLWSDFAASPASGAAEFPVALQLILPDGTAIPTPSGGFKPGHAYDFAPNGETLARLYCQSSAPRAVPGTGTGHDRRMLTLAIPATTGPAPSGLWHLKLSTPEPGFADTLAIWVERGETPEGFAPAGRQAYLDHGAYTRFGADGHHPHDDSAASPIKRFGTLSAAAGSSGVIVAGSSRASDASVSAFSSGSSALTPAHNGHPRQPTCAAASEASVMRPNILVTGTYSGSIVAVRGTSFAAPFTLRTALIQVLNGRPPQRRSAIWCWQASTRQQPIRATSAKASCRACSRPRQTGSPGYNLRRPVAQN
ncbi:hypothetical protein [Marinovum sp. KMM 9879]